MLQRCKISRIIKHGTITKKRQQDRSGGKFFHDVWWIFNLYRGHESSYRPVLFLHYSVASYILICLWPFVVFIFHFPETSLYVLQLFVISVALSVVSYYIILNTRHGLIYCCLFCTFSSIFTKTFP